MFRFSDAERVERVIRWAGLNTSSFAENIGLSSPQSLYQIKAGKHCISRKIAEAVCRRYPEIDFGWLFAGQGEMLRPQNATIPCFCTECTEVALGHIAPLPNDRCLVPGCGDCEFAAPTLSDNMEPEIMRGSLLFCRRCEPHEMISGSTYLVATDCGAFLRRLSKAGEGEMVFEASKEGVQSIVVESSAIKSVWIIKAAMEWKNV